MIIKWKTPLVAVKALIFNFLAWIQTGLLMAPAETVEKRLETCKGCVFYDVDFEQCTVCTCFVGAKAMFRAEKCPQGFWD